VALARWIGQAGNYSNAIRRRWASGAGWNIDQFFTGIVPVLPVGRDWSNEQEGVYAGAIGLPTTGTAEFPTCWINAAVPIWVHKINVWWSDANGQTVVGESATLFTPTAGYDVLAAVSFISYAGLICSVAPDRGDAFLGGSVMPQWTGFAGLQVFMPFEVSGGNAHPQGLTVLDNPDRPLLVPENRFIAIQPSVHRRQMFTSFVWTRAGNYRG
jgi:hypothetical protein